MQNIVNIEDHPSCRKSNTNALKMKLMIQPFASEFKSTDVNVPADISSAAFWIVAGLCHQEGKITLKNVGINPSRSGILDVMSAMGGKISVKNATVVAGEEVGDIIVESSELQGVEIGGDIIPRLIENVNIFEFPFIWKEIKNFILYRFDFLNTYKTFK